MIDLDFMILSSVFCLNKEKPDRVGQASDF
jgi:hypothetical protein